MGAETFGGPVVIDLGLARGEPETYAAPTRSTVPAWFGPLVAALLVLWCATASAAPPPPVLSPLLNLRVGPADSYVVTDGGQLLAQSLGGLSMYDLSSGRQRWHTEPAAPTYRLRMASGLVLLRPWSAGLTGVGDPGTTAVSLATGDARWRRTGNVVTLAGSGALLAVAGVRSLSGPGRRVEGPVDALDVVTGATRWRVRVPSTAVLLGVPAVGGAPPRMLLVHDDRNAAVHDLTTGAPLTTAVLPAADYGPDNPAVVGGLVLLRHPGDGATDLSAYDSATLRRRWTRPAGDAYEIHACGPLTCLVGPDGVRAVDPADGTQRWHRPDWRGVEQRGAAMLAYAAPEGTIETVGLIDPATGRVLADLRGWRPLTGTGGRGRVLVTHAEQAGARTMVAVASPGDARPRLLAALPAGTGDCQAAPARLVCRSTAGELIVWAYRQKG
ncbi:putative pyrroloquinoline-quinone binding quinoprotein [Krasilnikovia cinnamomea]|uniref:Putative pyrroloquinoline-quinone binding quinoprotein n=1 Tax=Krasilnikovia cinnamomea TaxID=349313 RepID=A0A4Q7ZFN5_9ACTN|nr:PQQ-binding-like beta-propeller repeat protein [Krasilnikovia cinnamomea]RZU49592.1 putative pyrroloquinoline-quinone binding quinoprotein [Krasilnikovia cinnamomea]